MPADLAHDMPPRDTSGLTRGVGITFPSTALSVRRALETVLSGLADLELEPEELGTVELVLAEALNNVVEHAYPQTNSGWIHLACHQYPDGLHFTIRDEGAPMPEERAPIGNRAPLPEELEALPEGGFGWFLIRDLSRDVRYRRLGNVNELTFRVNIGRDFTLH